MNKKIVIILISLIIVLAALSVIVWVFWPKPEESPPVVTPAVVEEKLSCFDSTKDPIPICNCQDLQRIKENLAADYQLQNDVDCLKTKDWNSGKGFEPIVSNTDVSSLAFQGAKFTGIFDGQNYIISNLFINRPDENFIGLFGYVEGKISNLGLKNVNIIGNENVGGLTGTNFNGAITNSYVTGETSGKENAGGLVGENRGDATITNSYANVNLFNCGKDVGGLVGENEGTITSSFAVGAVSGRKDIGGLVGDCEGIDDAGNFHIGLIDNCYATGNVTGDENVGGLIGNTNTATITNSYATGTISGNKDIGGLLGDNHVSVIKNSYSIGGVTGVERIGGLNGVNHSGTITNCFWYKPAGSSLDCVGRIKEGGTAECYIIDNNLSYFYKVNNKPMDVWRFPPWSKENDGKSYPILEWQ